MSPHYQGNLFVVAAPSGGGKTSMVHAVAQCLELLEISTSHTTRPMRPTEKPDVDYFFVSEPAFMEMVAAGEFIEHAKVFDYYYGTSIAQITSRLEAGIDVLLDIDWQGASQIKQLFPAAIGVFVLPPSLEELKRRLDARKRDDVDIIEKRMGQAIDEMRHFDAFDYVIVNDTFERACDHLRAIVIANRLTLTRQKAKVGNLISNLLSSHE